MDTGTLPGRSGALKKKLEKIKCHESDLDVGEAGFRDLGRRRRLIARRSASLVSEPWGRLLVSTQQAEGMCRCEAPKSVAVAWHA